MPTLRELSVEYAKKQPKQIDQLLEDAPILARLPFVEATHDMWNVYEELTEVEGASFIDLDAPLPNMSTKSELRQINLKSMGGKITVAEDKARLFGGPEAYFDKNMPAIMKKTGQTTETAILYDNFRKYAVDKHSTFGLLQNAGGTTGTGYTILAVRLDPGGENTGLYSPKSFNAGALLSWEDINGGNLYDIGGGVLGYGGRIKNYFGWQIASHQTIQAIVNVQKDKLPTETQLADALLGVKQNSSTYLMMHPAVLNWLGIKLKKELIRMTVNENGINYFVVDFNGVPCITSYNFKNNEPIITVS
jgi:hypothetical protein